MKAKVLIVEDQFIEAKSLKLILTSAGFHVCDIARSVAAAIEAYEKEKPDLVLVDIFLQGDETGIDLGKFLHARNIAFVYLSANSNRQILEAAKPTKPYGFMVKPFRAKDVLIMLDVALYLHKYRWSERSGTDPLPPDNHHSSEFSNLVGSSPAFVKTLDYVNIVAHSEVSVLLLGESGTGKELLAHSIHRMSGRRYKPFVVVNCGTLPANLVESELFGHEKGAFTDAAKKLGKFELADGGTIFLDEIGELPIELQVKFLRVLQEREIEPIGGKAKKINVRVIAATNKDLEELVALGKFRLDLFYRLNVFPLTIPPLRERKEDIPLLANHFLQKFSTEKNMPAAGFSEDAMTALMNYAWPGNIRELENTIHKSVILSKGPLIENIDIPGRNSLGDMIGAPRFKTIAENERDHILQVLDSCNWKISGKGGAAEILDINVNTLNSKMKKLGIEKQISAKK